MGPRGWSHHWNPSWRRCHRRGGGRGDQDALAETVPGFPPNNADRCKRDTPILLGSSSCFVIIVKSKIT